MIFKKAIGISIVLLLILAIALPVNAKRFGRHRDMAFGFGPWAILGQLDLTDAQKKQIAEVVIKYRDEIQQRVDALIQARQVLVSAIYSEPMVETDVRKASHDVAAIKEELDVLRAQIASEIRPILTAEQVQLLQDKRHEMAEQIVGRKEQIRERIDQMLERWMALDTE